MASRAGVRDRVVLITGAANGIGLDTARVLRARGARVAMLDVDGDRAIKQAESFGAGALGLQCDVTQRGAVDDAVAAVLDQFGRIDVAITNAGIGQPGTLSTISEADYNRVVAVNLDGTWNTVRATLPHLLESRGYLLVISSAYSFMNGIGMGAYPVTKAAVEAMGRALRIELANQGVAVGVAYFGFIDTDLVREAFADPAIQEMTKAIPGFVTKPIPVERASTAIADGVERRAARVIAPGWMRAALALRGLLALADGRFARDRHIQRAAELLREKRSG